jgi:hypothetical protein
VRLALSLTSSSGAPEPLFDEEAIGHCMLLCRALPEFAATGLCSRRCSHKGGTIQGGMVLVRTPDGVGFDSERLAILLYELADRIIARPRRVLAFSPDDAEAEETVYMAMSIAKIFREQDPAELTPTLESERARAIDVSNATNVILRGVSPARTLPCRLVVRAGMLAEPGSDSSTWVIDLSELKAGASDQSSLRPGQGEHGHRGADTVVPSLTWSGDRLEDAIESVPSADELVERQTTDRA